MPLMEEHRTKTEEPPGSGFRWDASLMPVSASQTHFHLLSIVNTELSRRQRMTNQTIRVLDVGCGDGLLLIYLSRALRACWPSLTFELYGFDVGDHGLQAPSFFRKALARLEDAAPSGRWGERLALISENEPWPYTAGFFDVVVSNQVLEHVRNQNLFFSELGRVLAPDGFSAHLYPSAHSLIEPHLHVPLAHWISDEHLLSTWLRFWSRIGISSFPRWSHARRAAAVDHTLDAYVREHVAFLAFLTNYKTQREMHAYAKAHGQASSFCYTSRYYSGKLKSLMGHGKIPIYRRGATVPAMLANILLRYVSSVTLLTSGDPGRKRTDIPLSSGSQSTLPCSA